MRKIIKFAVFVIVLAMVLEFMGVSSDKQYLQESVIRLHVVAASDSQQDQAVKLKVRDAVVSYVEEAMSHVMTFQEAKAWLQEHLPQIQNIANDVLDRLGFSDKAVATLQPEAFPMRHYDSLSLPSGVYDALRITIGEGRGQNWWCVVFPNLCLPAVGETTQDVAAGAGFDQTLIRTVTRREGYQIRFYFMDLLGKIENFFFGK